MAAIPATTHAGSCRGRVVVSSGHRYPAPRVVYSRHYPRHVRSYSYGRAYSCRPAYVYRSRAICRPDYYRPAYYRTSPCVSTYRVPNSYFRVSFGF